MGHPHKAILYTIATLVTSLNISVTNEVCHSCQIAKSHRLSFSCSVSTCTSPFQIIVSDVWEPSSVLSFSGYKYYDLFMDEFSHFSWIYPMVKKAETFSKIILFKAKVEKQFLTHIQTLRSDGGGECASS